MSLIVRLPFPAAELFPNRKNGHHWAKTNDMKESQKSHAYFAAKSAINTNPIALGKFQDGQSIPLSLLYLTPDKRHRDCDNMLAASKAMIDGVALALGIDDKRFKPVMVDWEHGPDKVGSLICAVGVEMLQAMAFEGVA